MWNGFMNLKKKRSADSTGGHLEAIWGENVQTPEQVLVIDVPMNTTADEAAALLDEPLDRNYYLLTVLNWLVPGVGARAFFKLRVKSGGASDQRTAHADATERLAEDRALEFIRDNPTMSIRNLRSALESNGFKRGHSWVQVKRTEIAAEQLRRITQ